VVIRNGVLYRDVDSASGADVCVLYWDGTMETYTSKEFDAEEAIDNGAYQAWCFGPMLVGDDGEAMTSFTTTVGGHNPRTVIGYFEPGHYCFVVVDGRSSASSGMSMKQLSALMVSLGCVKAYNLDGGQTSVMTLGSTVVSDPYKGGRKCSDIIYIGE